MQHLSQRDAKTCWTRWQEFKKKKEKSILNGIKVAGRKNLYQRKKTTMDTKICMTCYSNHSLQPTQCLELGFFNQGLPIHLEGTVLAKTNG